MIASGAGRFDRDGARIEGIWRLQAEFGEEKCQRLVALLERARAHFDADRKGVTKHYPAGRQLLIEVEDILMGKIK